MDNLMLEKALTHEIFSILENKFLFGTSYNNDDSTAVAPNIKEQSSLSESAGGRVRILSIDAGGWTDGVLAAKSLVHLETSLRLHSGNPKAHISDFFDIVAGSGPGGILASLLFTRGGSGGPMFTAEEALRFITEYNNKSSSSSLFKKWNKNKKKAAVLDKVFGSLTLKDTVKAVLIPCYDLNTGGSFVFSRADAFEMDGSCDFTMSSVCQATMITTRSVQLKSSDGTTKIRALGGAVAMTNPAAAAVTHVLNNKQEFPLCKGPEDLLLLSLGNGTASTQSNTPSLHTVAADSAADMVDQAVSMAFGESRKSNYFRIQGNGISSTSKCNTMSKIDEMLGQKNVESVLFQGRKLVDCTNSDKIHILAKELMKEQQRRANSTLPTVVLKQHSSSSPRTSSATTLSTLSSSS